MSPQGVPVTSASADVAVVSLLLAVISCCAFLLVYRRRDQSDWRWLPAIVLTLAAITTVPGILALRWYVLPFMGFFF